MKNIIDTIKEIISKDASTQTEPVTIVENEEDISKNTQIGATEGQQVPSFKPKRDEYVVDIRKGKRDDIISKKRLKLSGKDEEYLSGQDDVEQIKAIERIDAEQQIQTDASFLDKCENYVAKIYPQEIDSSDFYSGISGTLQMPIVEENADPNFDVERFSGVLKNIFNYEIDSDNTEEVIKENLILRTAGIYKVCVDNPHIQGFMQQKGATNFTDPGLLRTTILNYLAETSGEELAGEVFDILDNTN